MPLSLVSIFLGFVLGTAATAIVWNLTQRSVRNPEKTRLTALWNVQDVIADGTRPAVLAEGLTNVRLPAGSKVIVPREAIAAVPQEILSTCEVRMHPEVRINAVVGKDRALVFSGHVTPKAFAIFTRDEAAVHLLQADFSRMWGESVPYIEQIGAIADLKGKAGRWVDVTGKAVELMEYRGQKMLRLTDGTTNVGVVTAQQDVTKFQGSTVRVVGQFKRENGYAYLDAQKVVPVGVS